MAVLLHGFFCNYREWGATLESQCKGFHCGGFSCCRGQALGRATCSICGTWAQWLQFLGSRAQSLWHMGLVAPQQVGSSWIRDQTCVSCIDMQILYH